MFICYRNLHTTVRVRPTHGCKTDEREFSPEIAGALGGETIRGLEETFRLRVVSAVAIRLVLFMRQLAPRRKLSSASTIINRRLTVSATCARSYTLDATSSRTTIARRRACASRCYDVIRRSDDDVRRRTRRYRLQSFFVLLSRDHLDFDRGSDALWRFPLASFVIARDVSSLVLDTYNSWIGRKYSSCGGWRWRC